MARYPKYVAGEGGWSDWVQPIPNGYKIACCDCGLVHDMDFKTVKSRVQFRARRNNRATGQVRRHMKKDSA